MVTDDVDNIQVIKNELRVFRGTVEFFPACMAVQQGHRMKLVYYILPMFFYDGDAYMVLPPLGTVESAALFSAVDLPAGVYNSQLAPEVIAAQIRDFLNGPDGPRKQYSILLKFYSSYCCFAYKHKGTPEYALYSQLKHATVIPATGNIIDLTAVFGQLLLGSNFSIWNKTSLPTLGLELLAAG